MEAFTSEVLPGPQLIDLLEEVNHGIESTEGPLTNS